MAQAEVPDTLLMDSPHAQKEMALNGPVQLRLKDRYRLQRLVKLQSLLQGHYAGQVAGRYAALATFALLLGPLERQLRNNAPCSPWHQVTGLVPQRVLSNLSSLSMTTLQ